MLGLLRAADLKVFEVWRLARPLTNLDTDVVVKDAHNIRNHSPSPPVLPDGNLDVREVAARHERGKEVKKVLVAPSRLDLAEDEGDCTSSVSHGSY